MLIKKCIRIYHVTFLCNRAYILLFMLFVFLIKPNGSILQSRMGVDTTLTFLNPLQNCRYQYVIKHANQLRKKKEYNEINNCSTVFRTWFMKSQLFFEERSVGKCILNGILAPNLDLNNFSCPHWPYVTATTPALHPATCTGYYGHCSDGEPASPS